MTHSHLQNFMRTRWRIDNSQIGNNQARSTLENVSRRLSRWGVMKDSLCKRQEWECSRHSAIQKKKNPEKMREVFTIIGRPHMVGGNRNARDKYAKEARNLPQALVNKADKHPTRGTWREPKDIIFIEADARQTHHPHTDALVI